MSFILRRVLFYALALWVAVTVSFFLPRMVPGNPVAAALATITARGTCNATCAVSVEKEFGFGGTSTVKGTPTPSADSFTVSEGTGALFTVNKPVTVCGSSQPTKPAIAEMDGTIQSINGDLITLTAPLSQSPIAGCAVVQNLAPSLVVQYGQYLGGLFQGNLGTSYFEGSQSVTSLIGTYLPWTIGLLGVATVLSFLLGTGLGIVVAWRRGSRLDWVLPGATFFQAIPPLFLSMVVLAIFATGLHWFPTGGAYDITQVPSWDLGYIGSLIYHAILPALAVILFSMAGFTLGMRNQMVTTMDEDFVLVARAKGLPARRVVWYAARNAMLPSISNFAIAISLVVAGQLLVEVVFNYPGIGDLLYKAVVGNDYPLVQGIFVVIVLVVLFANLIADVIYVMVDPRAGQQA